MEMISVNVTVNQPIDKVWEAWTNTKDIMEWNFASNDWYCPAATNDLKVGGRFSSIMAAKDGSFSFDFNGVYSEVVHLEKITYNIEDGRLVKIVFEADNDITTVTEMFEPETENTLELQQNGWQTILNNFKNYVEKS
jgi:uncharacterized protein YndB with AHSA1/START domain